MDDGATHPGLRLGDIAPEFDLPNQFGEPVSLARLRGAAVMVVFYPFAFSGICTGELAVLQEHLSDFEDAGVHLLAVSVDTKYTLRAYAAAEGYSFELLADFWPHGKTAQEYGVFDSGRGMAGRSSFLITAEGVIADTFSTPTGQARPWVRYRESLDRL